MLPKIVKNNLIARPVDGPDGYVYFSHLRRFLSEMNCVGVADGGHGKIVKNGRVS